MFNLDTYVDCLKSIAEPSRLRILRVLADGDLTVSDLTSILGQSQPRVSRHLKLMLETGLINRWQEGSWALFRLVTSGPKAELVKAILADLDSDDSTIMRDVERLELVKRRRREAAAQYFAKNAASWDEIRSHHIPDAEIDAALLNLVGKGPFNAMLDIGTGTGHMLELFAPYYRSAVGIDASREMLGIARANIEAGGFQNCEVRLGDIYNMPVERNAYDLIVIHQVLHFLDDSGAALREAARSLAPSGKLVVVDFAPHEIEYLRSEHQHQRLGFETDVIHKWFTDANLKPADTLALSANKKPGDHALTVMIWSAEDQRIEIAGDSVAQKVVV